MKPATSKLTIDIDIKKFVVAKYDGKSYVGQVKEI